MDLTAAFFYLSLTLCDVPESAFVSGVVYVGVSVGVGTRTADRRK